MAPKKKLASLPEIPNKRYFPIREASQLCGVKDYVLRFWETEFPQLRPMKRGAQRAYRRKDILIARRIRELVYAEGYKLASARDILSEELKGSKEEKGAESEGKVTVPEAPASFFDLQELSSIIYNLEKIEEFLHN